MAEENSTYALPNGAERLALVNLPAPAVLPLALDIRDPEVVGELWRRPEGAERSQFALAALRLGVLALRQAAGQVDGQAIREAGDRLLLDIRELLSTRATALTLDLATTLKQYLDPASGMLPQRLQALVQPDGEIDRLLKAHVSPDESVLAKTLLAHLGSDSPIFKLLSPTEASGLRAQVTETLEAALKDQRERILQEFSLDSKESALSRVVSELALSQGKLESGFKQQVELVIKEFSLDDQNSALSRLVGRVEGAQRAISAEFSTDNETSALNKLSKVLAETKAEIRSNLTLDDEQSALARLKRELEKAIAGMVEKNQEFQTEVRATLEALKARNAEKIKGTHHGREFEQAVGSVLGAEAQRLGDLFESTGDKPGLMALSKVGDHLIELGSDSQAPGAKIVFEAKEKQGYDLKKALEEMDVARKNRGAQVGVFVYSSRTAPANLLPFARYGSDLVVVWDVEDPATDLYLTAAYSVARALAIRQGVAVGQACEAIEQIEMATRAVEKQIEYLGEIKTWANTVKNNGEKIADRADKLQKEITRAVDALDAQVGALKAADLEGTR
ncbi:MAG: hypothetical protein KGR26_05910 [Cyanobacteria bacterium REEB65]|nr:hypothetical protein [Cyanobacteria bacterium REEB65]